MSKELPYFKFDCAEWISGSITLEDLSTQGAFINTCAYFWFKGGSLTLTEIKRRVKCKQATWNRLIEGQYIKVDGDHVYISFLSNQFGERGHVSKINSINGSKGGAPKGNKNAEKNNRKQPKTSNIEENKKRIEKEENRIDIAVDTANKEKRELDFMETLKPFIGQYEKPMLREFYNYWIEPMKSGKMRFEAEKFWSLGRRLSTWSNNIKNNKYGKQPIGTPEDQRERIAAFLAAKEARASNANG